MTYDQQAFDDAGLIARREGNVAFFVVPPDPDEIAVQIVDNELKFYARRSAGHRRVLAKL